MMQKLGMEEGEAIEHPWVTKAIENAQRKVEGRNFDIRKQLLEYDDVANDQRKVIYQQRNELMDVDGCVRYHRGHARGCAGQASSTATFRPRAWRSSGTSRAWRRPWRTEFGGEWPIRKWLDEDHDLHEETLRQAHRRPHRGATTRTRRRSWAQT